MDILTLITCAIGLSMDAFAVSVCKGLAIQKLNMKQQAIVGAWFGGFQGLMPLVGFLLGVNFKDYIVSIDHWIAFILLALIGGNMIKEALSKDEDCQDDSLGFKTMIVLAVATSIDAVAVGFSLSVFPFPLPKILFSYAVTFIVTALASILGIAGGLAFSKIIGKKAELFGGIILIIIGIRILVEHIFFS